MKNNMEKQTAVDWLVENIYYLHSTKWNDIIEQAKVMEKEQILQALNDGKAMIISPTSNKSLEQYYNETYKQEE
jgi:predicted RecA/RadA family phage recombinase